ncbi:MAG: hypothetical protein ACLQO1_19320, partial [Steroidobacteraceae bacterium]
MQVLLPAPLDPRCLDVLRSEITQRWRRLLLRAFGGAERFYTALSQTLKSFNFKTEIIEIAAPEHDYTYI